MTALWDKLKGVHACNTKEGFVACKFCKNNFITYDYGTCTQCTFSSTFCHNILSCDPQVNSDKTVLLKLDNTNYIYIHIKLLFKAITSEDEKINSQ